ncbi:hypothetical protein PL321_12910 [Caloramator sp. mosi_1]|nr:hypothetical protein [Caloramator sp. mosi_1]WDC83567.1 hypothetical protein PL321_12910 [Caloramator sp. mosi_1]
MVRKEQKQIQYEYNTGWQKVIKSDSESIFDDINSKIQRLNLDVDELKNR